MPVIKFDPDMITISQGVRQVPAEPGVRMLTEQFLDEFGAEFRYNVDQLRDSHGRFAEEAGNKEDHATALQYHVDMGVKAIGENNPELAGAHFKAASAHGKAAKASNNPAIGPRASVKASQISKAANDLQEQHEAAGTPEEEKPAGNTEQGEAPKEPEPEADKPYVQKDVRIVKQDYAKGEARAIVKQALDKFVPKEHLDRLNKITFRARTKEMEKDGDRNLGLYSNRGHEIEITVRIDETGEPDLNWEDRWADNGRLSTGMQGVVLHEVGHYVHLGKLSKKAANEWNRISDNGNNAKISSYARTNTTEHFAEAYRAFAENSTSLRSSAGSRQVLLTLEPKAYAFMERVFSNPSSMLKPPGSRVSPHSYWSRSGPRKEQ